MKIAYYISAHGYGHGVRSSDILRSLNIQAPEAEVVITTGLPESFLRNRLPSRQNRYRSGVFDVGMVQLDSIRVDVEATRKKVEALVQQWDALVEQECRFLDEEQVDRVVVDIPAIPIQAAKTCGLDCMAVGNFAWDWIYRPFAEKDVRWEGYAERFAVAYGQADLLLKLPFSEPMSAFRAHHPLPLLSERGRSRRAELAQRTGVDEEKKWILLSFTTLDWDAPALQRVEALTEYAFFTVKPLAWVGKNIYAVDRNEVCFSDVLASCDAVITKPGYGILSECVVNEKPLIYAEREDFVEYPILVEAIERYVKNVHIPAVDLYKGHVESAVAQIWMQPEPPFSMSNGGAGEAAEIILGK